MKYALLILVGIFLFPACGEDSKPNLAPLLLHNADVQAVLVSKEPVDSIEEFVGSQVFPVQTARIRLLSIENEEHQDQSNVTLEVGGEYEVTFLFLADGAIVREQVPTQTQSGQTVSITTVRRFNIEDGTPVFTVGGIAAAESQLVALSANTTFEANLIADGLAYGMTVGRYSLPD